jgi:hypothetical protein
LKDVKRFRRVKRFSDASGFCDVQHASGMFMWIAHTLIVLALIASPTRAAMVKCQGVGGPGSVIYQDVPCAAGKELRNFDTDPANVSIVPAIVPRPSASSPEKSGHVSRTTARAAHPERRSTSKRAEGNPAERKHISSGMAQGEVLARIGKPNVVSGGRKAKNWVYFPAPGDESTMTTLSMSDGRVARVDRKVMR